MSQQESSDLPIVRSLVCHSDGTKRPIALFLRAINKTDPSSFDSFVGVGAGVHEFPGKLGLVLSGGEHQRGPTIGFDSTLSVDIGARLNQ